MMSKNKKEQSERNELRKILTNAYGGPAHDPTFTRRVMRKARYSRPTPYLLRFCNKAAVFFSSPIWPFIALAVGIGFIQDEIITVATTLSDGHFFNSIQEMQSILILGGLTGLIFFACKEMIHETDN